MFPNEGFCEPSSTLRACASVGVGVMSLPFPSNIAFLYLFLKMFGFGFRFLTINQRGWQVISCGRCLNLKYRSEPNSALRVLPFTSNKGDA